MRVRGTRTSTRRPCVRTRATLVGVGYTAHGLGVGAACVGHGGADVHGLYGRYCRALASCIIRRRHWYAAAPETVGAARIVASVAVEGLDR